MPKNVHIKVSTIIGLIGWKHIHKLPSIAIDQKQNSVVQIYWMTSINEPQ